MLTQNNKHKIRNKGNIRGKLRKNKLISLFRIQCKQLRKKTECTNSGPNQFGKAEVDREVREGVRFSCKTGATVG